jgi:hypothetical protein
MNQGVVHAEPPHTPLRKKNSQDGGGLIALRNLVTLRQ